MNEKEAREELKKHISLVNKDYVISDYCEKCVNIEAIETVLNLLEKKDKESHFIQSELDIANAKIIKLNKIIDLMAGTIANEPLPTEEYCIIRTYDCPIVGGNRDCNECVKQYFERKVENGN